MASFTHQAPRFAQGRMDEGVSESIIDGKLIVWLETGSN